MCPRKGGWPIPQEGGLLELSLQAGYLGVREDAEHARRLWKMALFIVQGMHSLIQPLTHSTHSLIHSLIHFLVLKAVPSCLLKRMHLTFDLKNPEMQSSFIASQSHWFCEAVQ